MVQVLAAVTDAPADLQPGEQQSLLVCQQLFLNGLALIDVLPLHGVGFHLELAVPGYHQDEVVRQALEVRQLLPYAGQVGGWCKSCAIVLSYRLVLLWGGGGCCSTCW